MSFTDAPGASPDRPLTGAALLGLLVLTLAHVAARLWVSPALKWDEGEQMLWSQQLAWGYGAQPPLYTWLQWGFNAALGPSVLALSLLKHTLLALTYLLMALAARQLMPPRAAVWASASMLLIPALGWTSVRDQTHSVLVTCAVAGSWWALLRLWRRPAPAGYALLGFFVALGVLAKYNYALFTGALLLAALSVRPARAALLAPGWWWAPLVAALLLLPHGLWLLGHWSEASAETLQKMQIDGHTGVPKGLGALAQGLAATLLPWAVLALACFGRGWWTAAGRPAHERWMLSVFGRYLLLIATALLAMVLLAGVSHFKERWLLPLLCAVPLMAFACRPGLAKACRGSWFTIVIVVFATIFLLMAAGRAWYAGKQGKPDELNHPVAALTDALRQAGYDGHSPIIAADHMLAGMLRTRFPAAPAQSCTGAAAPLAQCLTDATAHATQAGQGWLLISRADKLEPGWWSMVRAVVGDRAPQSLRLPFVHLPAEAAPAHYQFIWHARDRP